MEPSEEPSQNSKDNFLEIPSLSDSPSEDEDVKATFKPGYSPQPSRRSSGSSEDMYLDTPTSGTRRVSFADNFGFNLVSIKEFDSWELLSGSTDFELKKDIFHTEEYVLSPQFELPSSKEDLMQQLQVRKAVLESTEYPPGSTSMKGIIRVLNVSFEKLVYVRMSLDDWQTYYDILAEYVPNSCDGDTDQFSFKISLVPPYQKDGSKVEFCIRYETSAGTFWSNNNGTNYILVCQKKEQEPEPEKTQEEVSSRQIKGCLKVKSSKEESSTTSEENNFDDSKIIGISIPTIVCSREDKKDVEASNQNVKDVNREHDGHNEKELELMINQRLIRTESAASRDIKETFSTDSVNFPSKAEGLEKRQIHSEFGTDLFRGPLSPTSSEEVTLATGEIKSSPGDTGSDELVQLHISSKEVLDDNANPAHRSRRVKASHHSTDQLGSSDLNKNHEGGTTKSETKDWAYLRRDFHSDELTYVEALIEKRSPKEDDGEGSYDIEQRIHMGINEKESKNFQTTLHDQEGKGGHSEISVEGTEARNRELTALPSSDTPILTQAITVDMFPSSTTNLSQKGAVLTKPGRDLSTEESNTFEGAESQVCHSRNGNVSRDDHLFHAEEEKSSWLNPEGQDNTAQHKPKWNVLESQRKARGSNTNITEQIKKQADCEETWEKRDDTRSLKGFLTEELFTCQEMECCELSPLADHGITQKAQAGTAYIIKTTSESTSAREKAIIAKLPQETARSDRPIEVKETAFDPHEGRNDGSRSTLYQRDSAGVIYDNDFERKSHSDICKVHVDKTEKQKIMSTYNPGKVCDREKQGTGNGTSVGESSQVITGNPKAMSNLGSHLEELPQDKRIFPENRDLGQVQESSKQTELDAVVHSVFTSDTSKAPQYGSHVSSHHATTSTPSHEQTVDNMITAEPLQFISVKSEDNCSTASEIHKIQGHLESKPEEVCTSSEIMTSVWRKEKCVGHSFQHGERPVEKSLGPMISISEPLENTGEARHGNEGLLHSGQSHNGSSGKASESSAPAGLLVQKSETQSEESLLSKYTNSKIPYFLLFLIFLVTIYQYDFMVGLAFYLFSLYWLCRDGGGQRESVKKQ
ncbi:protein phosphatase 1 regulatory subunit 3A [Ctenodactylus gundi]